MGKMVQVLGMICFGCLVQVTFGESQSLRVPAKVEKNPKLSTSYIPAAMQIIAHDTELMKYVIKPPQGTTTTTTTTIRPTPTHRPGIFAPSKPLGPTTFFSRSNIEAQNIQNQQQPSGLNYFSRYPVFLSLGEQEGRTLQNGGDIYEEVDKYLGRGFGEVLRLANRIDLEYDGRDPDGQLLDFSKKFEDPESSHRFELLRQKRVPPTKAYVTLLSLYDLLNKEAKKLMLNKYAGYTNEVLNNLVEFSSKTSSYQLRSVLNELVENQNTKKTDILTKINDLLKDLDMEGSYINDALKGIPPLTFAN